MTGRANLNSQLEASKNWRLSAVSDSMSFLGLEMSRCVDNPAFSMSMNG
jgi:hypothetical protein